MRTDLTHALRQFARAPVFSAVAVLTLALCIGANSAIFSVVHAVLFQPYPWADADRMLYVCNSYPGLNLPDAGVSVPDYLDRKAGVRGFADAGLYSNAMLNFAPAGAEPLQITALRATPSLFTTLQAVAEVGRTFTEADATPDAPPSVLLSHALWQSAFGSDPAIVGRSVLLNGRSTRVVGVMPAAFYFPSPRVAAWVPFAITPAQRTDNERGTEYSSMVARLKPGATLEQAREDLDLIERRNEQRLPESAPFWRSTRFHGEARPFLEQQVGGVRSMLWLVQAAVATALLIGCANVAGLLLARAVARERELAVRAALGASRGQLMRLLLTESALLFAAGAALGIGAAEWGLAALQKVGFTQLPRGANVRLDLAVVAFTMICAAAAAGIFGAMPAWTASRAQAGRALKEAGNRGGTLGRRTAGLRNALVAGEVALAVMLLATASLLIQSFRRLQEQPAGFRPGGVLTADINLPAYRYDTLGKLNSFRQTLMDRIAAAPGVVAAGQVDVLPFSGGDSTNSYTSPDIVVPPGAPAPHGRFRAADPGYRAAMGLTLLRGRWFTPADSEKSQPVAVVDRVLVDRYWKGQDPLGKRIVYGNAAPRLIVGVVGAVKNRNLEEDVTKETVYVPLAQSVAPMSTLVVRAAGNPSGLAPEIKEALRRVDPQQPIANLRTMNDRMDQIAVTRRSPMVLISAFSLVALLLASLGVYGVLAFSAAQRVPEFGVRIALGATGRDIILLVLRQALLLLAAGVGAGLLGYLLISRLVAKLLFGIGALDAVTLVTVPIILSLVALLAGLLPARRAARVDPMVALRSE